MKPHIEFSVLGVRSASRPRALTENTRNSWELRNDIPGDTNRKISMMVATDSIHGSIFAVVARENGGQDDNVMQSFQKKMLIGWVWSWRS